MNTFRFTSIFALLLYILFPAQAQIYSRLDTIQFTESGHTLRHPYAGGMNMPQFSAMDLDGDGIKDLVVFDRAGDKLSTFINGGTPSAVDYVYRPQYEAGFPDSLKNWVLLRDFNCDGLMDIFTGVDDKIRVYKNTGAPGAPVFSLYISIVQSDYGMGFTNLMVSLGDLPDISDVDGDGDPDILTFNSGGQTIGWHKNLSRENTGACDTLIFTLADACWGKLSEDPFNNTLTLGVSCRVAPQPETDTEPFSGLHSGSTITSFDTEGDGDREIVLGDLLFPNLVYARNGGTSTAAFMDTSDASFPWYDSPVDIELFPAAFFLDMNNDGNEDLVVAPNAYNISYDYNNVWYYQNAAAAPAHIFALTKLNVVQEDMVDAGTSGHPVFFDENADGLEDMLVANLSYKVTGIDRSSIFLYRNTGTATDPAFDLVTTDWQNLSTVFSPLRYALSPAFGDMDNDGDADMILGDIDGNLHYFTNTAGPGNPVSYSLTFSEYKNIDVGQFSVPFIIDIDRDGDPDLVVGEMAGNLNYFENTGTAALANFTTSPTSSTFGKVDTYIPCCTGFAVPFLWENPATGEYEMLVGTEHGEVWHYVNIEDSLTGAFTRTTTSFGNFYEGQRSAISGADLNDDGRLDFAVGNYRGGVALFSEDGPASQQDAVFTRLGARLAPNPSGGASRIVLENATTGTVSVLISDVSGKIIWQADRLTPQGGHTIELPAPAQAGVYAVRVTSSEGRMASFRWVVLR